MAFTAAGSLDLFADDSGPVTLTLKGVTVEVELCEVTPDMALGLAGEERQEQVSQRG